MTIENTAYASEDVTISDRRKFAINADLLDRIKQVVETVKSENPETSLENLILYATKYFLKNPDIRPNNFSVTPAIFVYYLETFNLFEENDNTEDSYNRACLSLFSLFPEHYNDTTLRKLIIQAAEVLNEIITQRLSVMKELKVADVLPSLTHITVVAESIRKYTSVKYRKANIKYISWTKDFFEKCLNDPKLTFMDQDDSIKTVLTQVTSGKKIITV